MARPVAFSPQTNEPVWLTDGKQALVSSRRLGSSASMHGTQGDSPSARTAHRFARIAEFLETHYPLHFAGTRPVRAGSAVLLELMKLHQFSPELAAQNADRCLAGEITVADLRSTLARVRAEPEVGRLADGRAATMRWLANFTQMALRRVKDEALLPNASDIEAFQLPDQRAPMAPDLIAYYRNEHKVVAVEVKAPRDASPQSISNVAHELISRVAVLRLHFDDALLVLPEEADGIATKTVELWEGWVRKTKRRSSSIDMLLLGEKTHRWVSSKK
jgi:hypothetical protein